MGSGGPSHGRWPTIPLSLPSHPRGREVDMSSQVRMRNKRAPRLNRGALNPLETALIDMQRRSRGGATVTEALIALLIMSIGLVALAVLFPLSVLRSIKASQFTNATDVRYNAEAAIDQF